jgi:O-antigen/teichoic acid export membrane protein
LSGVRVGRSTGDLTRHSGILFVGLMVVNASNYAFHVVVSRVLGPERYGALGGILSGFVWITTCGTAVQLVVAKHMSHRSRGHGEQHNTSLGEMLEASLVLASVTTAALLAASGWLTHFLGLGTRVPAILLALYALPTVVGAVARGGLQGRLSFRWLAAVWACTTLLRLVIGVAFVVLGWGVSGAVASSVAAELIGAAMAIVPLRDGFVPSPKWGLGSRALLVDLPVAISSIGGFWLLVGSDTFLVRHYVAGARAGDYAAAAVAARSSLFFPAAIVMVSFPHFAALARRRAEARRLLTRTLAAVAVLSASFAILLTAFRSPAVRLLFGERFSIGGPLMGLLASAMALLAIVNVLIHFALATRSTIPWSLAPAFVLEAAGIAMFHGSLVQVALVMLTIAGVLVVHLATATYASLRQTRGSSGDLTE